MQTVLKEEIPKFLEEIKSVTRNILEILSDTKVYDEGQLDKIENLLLRIAYKASVLSLPEVSLLVNPSARYVHELKTAGTRITRESLSFIKQVLKKLHYLIKSLELPDDKGVFIDSSAVVVNSFFKNPPEMDEIFRAYKKRQINPGKINRFRKLSFRKDPDFAYAINLPQGIVKENRGNFYISLFYTDVSEYKSIDDFTEIIKKIDRENNSIIHGPLQIPLKSALEKETILPYYILLKTHQEPEKFIKSSSLKGHLIRILHRPKDYSEELAVAAKAATTAAGYATSEKTEEKPAFSDAAEGKAKEKKGGFTKEQYRRAVKSGQIRFSIGFKMISIISMIIIMALSGMIFLATWFFLQDSRIRVEENNLKVSEVVSMKIEEDIKSFGNAASLLMLGANQTGEEREDFIRYFFRNEPGVIYAGLHTLSRDFLKKNKKHQNKKQ